jgi:hypothetical protein
VDAILDDEHRHRWKGGQLLAAARIGSRRPGGVPGQLVKHQERLAPAQDLVEESLSRGREGFGFGLDLLVERLTADLKGDFSPGGKILFL